MSHLIVFWKAIVVKTGKDECFVEGLTVGNLLQNIARGTTDPEIESVHLSNLLNNSIIS